MTDGFSHDADSIDEVVVDCELDAAPEKVWRALTVPELAAQWLETDRSGENAAGDRSYALIEAEPYNRVRYAWRDETASEPDTVVTIVLSPAPAGRTRFRLTHSVSERTMPVAVNSNRPPTAMAA
jgi:uncharacterized protein YndB with AHSA1/START domain